MYIQLSHPKKFSEDDFKEIIFKATENVLKKIKAGELKRPAYFTYEAIFPDVVRELITSFGFKKLEYTVTWDCFGWPSILNEKHWPNDRQSLKELTEYLHERVYTSQSMNERRLI